MLFELTQGMSDFAATHKDLGAQEMLAQVA